MGEETKTCPGCGETKSKNGGFYRSGASKDGTTYYCRACTKQNVIAWQKANPEKKAANDKKTKDKNRERVREYMREYRKKNPDKNRERHRRYSEAYKKRDPEKRRQMNQIHNNRQRAKKLGVENTFQWSDWLAALDLFGHACAFCGVKHVVLDLEHLVSLSDGGANAPGNVVPACRPCNASKWRKSLGAFCTEMRISAEAILQKVLPLRAREVPA